MHLLLEKAGSEGDIRSRWWQCWAPRLQVKVEGYCDASVAAEMADRQQLVDGGLNQVSLAKALPISASRWRSNLNRRNAVGLVH